MPEKRKRKEETPEEVWSSDDDDEVTSTTPPIFKSSTEEQSSTAPPTQSNEENTSKNTITQQQITDIQQEISSFSKRFKVFEDKFTNHANDLADCKKELVEYKKKLTDCNKELAECKKDLKNCKEISKKSEGRLDKCESSLSSCEKKLNAHDKSLGTISGKIETLNEEQELVAASIESIMDIVKPASSGSHSITASGANRKGYFTQVFVDLLTESSYENATQTIVNNVSICLKENRFVLNINLKSTPEEITENVVIFPKYCGSARFQNAAASTLAQQGKKVVFLLYRYGNTVTDMVLGSEFNGCAKVEFKIKNLTEKMLDDSSNMDSNIKTIADFISSNGRTEEMPSK